MNKQKWQKSHDDTIPLPRIVHELRTGTYQINVQHCRDCGMVFYYFTIINTRQRSLVPREEKTGHRKPFSIAFVCFFARYAGGSDFIHFSSFC